MTALERADGFKVPAGESAVCASGEQAVPTRDLQTLSSLRLRVCGNHGDPAAGAEHRAAFDKPKQRGGGCKAAGSRRRS